MNTRRQMRSNERKRWEELRQTAEIDSSRTVEGIQPEREKNSDKRINRIQTEGREMFGQKAGRNSDRRLKIFQIRITKTEDWQEVRHEFKKKYISLRKIQKEDQEEFRRKGKKNSDRRMKKKKMRRMETNSLEKFKQKGQKNPAKG